MDKRRAVFVLIMGVALCTRVEGKKHGEQKKLTKPNFLFLICDSMDGRVVDPTSYISAAPSTPNFDKMAANGVNFVNNYCPSPQCVPSRAAMFSGRFPHKTKAWSNAQGLCKTWSDTDPDKCTDQGNSQSWNTFDYHFKEAGYNLDLIGKVDVGAGLGGGFHGDDAYAALTAWTRGANITHPQKGDPRGLVKNNMTNPKGSDWNTIEKCVTWLNSNAKADQPFFLYCSVGIPHPSYETNSTWLAMVNDSAVTVPKWLPWEEMHPADQYESMSKACYYEGMEPFTDADIRGLRKAYFAMCSQTDAMMGRVIDTLDSLGLRNNTYVLFTSDHGEGALEHRQNWKNSMYDANNRVPLLFTGPGVNEKVVVQNATSTIDLYPTLLELANLTVPDGLDGHSLLPFMFEDRKHDSRPDYIFGEYHSNMANTGHFMIKRGDLKYVDFGRTPPFQNYKPQLFNLSADPEELNDISSSNPQLLSQFSDLMSSIADIQAVDQVAKQQDKARFLKWQQFVGEDQWVKKLASEAYFGPGPEKWGTPDDVAQVEKWLNGSLFSD